jgi:hypothetical protein
MLDISATLGRDIDLNAKPAVFKVAAPDRPASPELHPMDSCQTNFREIIFNGIA